MAHWADFEAVEPELADRVKAILTARKHHTLATLRKDGSPRVSGIEVELAQGDLILGMMPESVKLADVCRDPRVALHALSDDPPENDQATWRGDVKVAGLATERRGRPEDQPPGPRFWVDITAIILTHLDGAATQLEIESWHPGRGREVKRRA